MPSASAGGTSYQGFTATQSYAYDSLNRLQSAAETIGGAQTWKQTYVYDRFGNRTFDAANTEIDPSNNQLKRTQYGEADVYLYDAAGNLTKDAAGKRYDYDGENKQSSFFDAGNNSSTPSANYFYDGDGKRIKKMTQTETTVFVYDASGKMVAEYSTAAPPQTPQTSYLTADTLGSPRVITDQNGNVTSRRDFLPFGEDLSTPQRTQQLGYAADTVRQKFTGYERDSESGLDYAQARYYNKQHGRFMSVDPENAGADESDPQTWNGYSYVRNNPTIFADHHGLEIEYCYSNGECHKYTDAQFASVKKELQANGIIFQNNQTFIALENGSLQQIGSYRNTDFDGNPLAQGMANELNRQNPLFQTIGQVGVAVLGFFTVPAAEAAPLITGLNEGAAVATAARAAVAPTLQIVESSGGVILASAETAAGKVEVVANISKEGGKLILKGLHVDGPGANSLGTKGVLKLAKEFAKQIGKEEGVSEVVIEGGRRTTGANPGRIPAPITIKIN